MARFAEPAGQVLVVAKICNLYPTQAQWGGNISNLVYYVNTSYTTLSIDDSAKKNSFVCCVSIKEKDHISDQSHDYFSH